MHQAKLNLTIEIDYLQHLATVIKDEQIEGSQAYQFYREDTLKAHTMIDKKLHLPNASQNETN